MTIRAYHASNDQSQRDICLIPSSAHGTNPASAVMAGLKVVVVKCDEEGNVDVDDLKAKADANKDELAALMITYSVRPTACSRKPSRTSALSSTITAPGVSGRGQSQRAGRPGTAG